MKKLSLPKIDIAEIVSDFKSLDPKDPGLWPLVPRIIILVGCFAVLIALAWWLGWRPQLEELEGKYQEESRLKDEWLGKKKQAINLEEYRKQLAEINRSFGALLKQLPNASEMESLLLDINQAGLGRGLQFQLFKPGGEVTRDFFAELPITLKLTGGYHDFGAFSGDIAKLPRIVTLNEIDVAPTKDGGLQMSAVAKTFRFLDETEVAQQKKAKADASKGGKK